MGLYKPQIRERNVKILTGCENFSIWGKFWENVDYYSLCLTAFWGHHPRKSAQLGPVRRIFAQSAGQNLPQTGLMEN
jgi:hypothetical protein